MPGRDNWGLSWPREDVALMRIDSFAVKDWAEFEVRVSTTGLLIRKVDGT